VPAGNALPGRWRKTLSAGTNFQQDAEGKPVKVEVVNLLVSPEQAELLSLASNETKIQLVLRNPLDRGVSKTPAIEMATLFGEAAPRQPVRPGPVGPPRVAVRAAALVPPVYTIQVLNGSKQSQQTFPVAGVRQ
jgi:pilus assembly protein CpaB